MLIKVGGTAFLGANTTRKISKMVDGKGNVGRQSFTNGRNEGVKLPLTKVVSAVLPPSEPGGSSAFSCAVDHRR